jgi:hypothetical protein
VESSVARQNRIGSTLVKADVLVDTVRELAAEFRPTRAASPDCEEGHMPFSGPSATSGYFRNPDDTRGLFHREWVGGDYGYIAEGEIYERGSKTGAYAVW